MSTQLNSQRFIKLFLSLIVMLICVYYSIIFFVPGMYYFKDEAYPEWMQQLDCISADGDTFNKKIVFIGDSTVKAGIFPKEISDNAYNLALQGADPVVIYYSLKYYFEQHKPDKVIVAFHMNHYYKLDTYMKAGAYYHYFRNDDIVEIQNTLSSIASYSEEKMSEAKKYMYYSPYMYFKTLLNGKMMCRNENERIYDNITNDCGYRELGNKNGCSEIDTFYIKYPKFIYSVEADYYIKEIIKLCKKNGVDVVITHMPYSRSNYEYIKNSGHLKDFMQYFTDLSVKTNANIEIEIPILPDEFFGDVEHLNHKGAVMYSKYIKEKYGL